MSALARILKSRGCKIYGSDLHASDLTQMLQEEGIDVVIGEAPQFVIKCDAVVYTSAVSKDNKDLLLAKQLNKPIFSRAQLLGELSKEHKTISVAGCHGKTTTTAMISNCLINANKDPTVHIGGISNNINSNLRVGKGELFVSEACEYKDSFLSLKNFIAVVLNIEEDHLDYFGNLDNIFTSFNKFGKNTSKNGVIIYNFDCIDERLKINKKSISFGFNDGADVQAKNLKEKKGLYRFDLFYQERCLGNIKLNCYGKHNIYNALATSAVCIFLGLSFREIKEGLETFSGIERRFQVLRNNKALIFHDYAHHPKEISSCIKACREIGEKDKIITIFQPHTFTRTRDLWKDFLTCFNGSDEVWLLPIYPAREEPIKDITSFNLYKEMKKCGKNCKYFDNFSTCLKEIAKTDEKGNIIAILGAGDIYDLAKEIIKEKSQK